MMMDQRSKQLRRSIVDALEGGRRGHLGSSMSMVEILRVLYDSYLQFRPEEPLWPERDRFILSKGHGCLTLYAILADKGFFPKEELLTFCAPTSRMGGHPELGKLPGVEASTGALGHGLSMAVGMAIAAKIRKQSYRVVVVTGDGGVGGCHVCWQTPTLGVDGIRRLQQVAVVWTNPRSAGSGAAN